MRFFFSRKKGDFLFFIMYLCAFVLYLTILLTSQSHVDGDEGVIGVMAQHILKRNARPTFFYGQAYGGGAAIEAYLASIPFLLFGSSSISLKIVAFTLTMISLFLIYVFCKQFCSTHAALLSFIVMATATPLVEWHTKMRGGYAGLLLSSIVILLIFFYLAYENKTKYYFFLLLGIVSGLAYYNSALILSLLAALIIASAYWRKIFWKWKSIILVLFGFFLGIAPLIPYELTHDFANTKFVFGIGSGVKGSIQIHALTIFSKFLPAFFVGRNVDQYVDPPPYQAWIEYIIYASILLYSFYQNRKSFLPIISAWISPRRINTDQKAVKPETLLILSILIHLLVCVFSDNTSLSPRYFLPMFPALAILTGSAIDNLLSKNTRGYIYVCTFIVLILVGSGISTHLSYIRPSTVNDDVMLKDGRIVNVQTSGKAAPALVNFLVDKGIGYVRTAYFIQWRLLFESREQIIASSNGFVPGLSRFKEYDERVDQADRVAFIYHEDSAQINDFISKSSAIELESTQIYEYIIFYPALD